MEAFQKDFCQQYLKKIHDVGIDSVDLLDTTQTPFGCWMIHFSDGTSCAVPGTLWHEFDSVRDLIDSKIKSL